MDEVEVELTNGIKFNLIHNMPYNGILSINSALIGWCAKTKDYAPENFVRYVRNSKIGYKVFTRTQYKNYLSNLEAKKKGEFKNYK